MPFQTEKAALNRGQVTAKAFNAMFLFGAAVGFSSALLLAGSLDKISKALLTTTGMAGLASYTICCKISEKNRKIDTALDQVQWESLKYQLKEEEQIYKLNAEVEGSARKVELILNKSNPWEWGYWANRVGVQPNMPPLQELTAEVVDQPVAHRVVETQAISFEQEPPNLAKQLADDMKNTLVVGVPGSGKGLLISNALAHVQDRGDTTVFYVDPKNDAKETGYFTGRVNYLFRLNGGVLKSQPIEVYQWLKQCFDAYESFEPGNGRKLLILDEITALMRKLANVPAKVTGTVRGSDWLEEMIVTYAASGDSAGATLWGVAQNGHNTGVGMDGGAKSQLTPIALISIKQLFASQALLKADFVPQDQKLSSSEIKLICQQSPIGRAIFHGGLNEWFPMPVLPNPSGYDRDNRRYVEKESLTVCSDSESDWYEEITTWVQKLGRKPQPQELKQKWESLTGQVLSPEGLRLLLEHLGI